VYELCPTTLYSGTQSHYSLLPHDISLQFTSLDNVEGEPRLLCCYCRSYKTLQLYFSERIALCRNNTSTPFTRPSPMVRSRRLPHQTECTPPKFPPLPGMVSWGRHSHRAENSCPKRLPLTLYYRLPVVV